MTNHMKTLIKTVAIIAGVIVIPFALLYSLSRIASGEYLFLRFSIPKYPNTTDYFVYPPDWILGTGGPNIQYFSSDSCEQIFQFYEKKFQEKKWTLLESKESGDISHRRAKDFVHRGEGSREWQAKNLVVTLECVFDGETSGGTFFAGK